MPPKKALKELAEEFKKQSPGGGAPTIGQTSELLRQEQARFDFFTGSAEKKARYKVLYGFGGDEISAELETRLKETNDVIKKTYSEVFPKLLQCVQVVNSKQCN